MAKIAAHSSTDVNSGSHCISGLQQNLPFQKIVVHPLVLLSVVDHFNRVSKSRNVKRVIGILLGSVKPNKTLDIANSFAVPFDEEDKDKSVFFLDVDYLENMYGMFYKVAAKEKIVGWYHTGPKLCKNDIAINALLKKFTPNPVLVIIQASHKDDNLTNAFIEVQEVHDDGTPPIRTFEHMPSEIDAEEAEEVGVEHLLRDIKDQTAGTLSQRITNQLLGLRGLHSQLAGIQRYLLKVAEGGLPINHAVVYYVQELLNLLPDITLSQFVDAQTVQTNNQMMSMYLGSLVRAIISLHNLIENKLELQKPQENAAAVAKAQTSTTTEKKKTEKKKVAATADDSTKKPEENGKEKSKSTSSESETSDNEEMEQ